MVIGCIIETRSAIDRRVGEAMILGLGHDVVDVPAFVAQMTESDGWKQLFSPRELRQVALRSQSKGDAEIVHFAARWAGKEAVIKAWCEALAKRGFDYPYTLDNTPWNGIEIISDAHGCPSVVLSGGARRALVQSLKLADEAGKTTQTEQTEQFDWHISLTHDGNYASAVVILEAR